MASYEDQFDDEYTGETIEPPEVEAVLPYGAIKRFPAKFNSKCTTCGAWVKAGTPCEFITPDSSKSGKWEIVSHPGCTGEKPAVAPPPEREERHAERSVRRDTPAPEAPGPTLTEEGTKAEFDARFAKLSDEQRRIALWRPHMGNVRVLAAAGSGKTATTTCLVGRLVRDEVLAPGDLVVTTFTKKAAGELVARLKKILPLGAVDTMRVGTFHSLAFKAISHNAVLKSRMPRDAFMDESATRKIWRQILDEVWNSESAQGYVEGTSHKSLGDRLRDLNEGETADVKSYMTAVDVARSAPGDYDVIAERLQGAEAEFPLIVEAWKIFCESKRSHDGWDFADALSNWELALAKGEVKSAAKLVIVDEAQDNNLVQASIAMMMAKNGKGNVILVGDVRQSIYAWRGAEPQIMIDADQTLGASTMEITTNYRSARKIVALGNAICEGKDYAVGSPSRPREANAAKGISDPGDGLITITGAGDTVGEAEIAAQRIADTMANEENKAGYSRFAILGRTRAQGGAAEAVLVSKKIPCVVVGGTPFFKRNEVVATLAWIKGMSGMPIDRDEILKLAKYPATGLGPKYADALAWRISKGEDFVTATDMVTQSIYAKQRQKAEDLALTVQDLAHKIGDEGDAQTRWLKTLDEIQAMFAAKFEARKGDTHGEDEDDKGDPGTVLLTLAKQFPGPAALMQFAAQCAVEVTEVSGEVTQEDLPPGRVVISTIHKSKGLEWPVVFVSASAGQFPHKRSTNVPEEERCFYVAVTRAERECHLTYAAEVNGQEAGPSRFLDYATPFVVQPG